MSGRGADPAAREACAHDGCITCGDEALPLRVVAVDAVRELAVCEEAGGRREPVDLGVVDGVREGDVVLVHAGTALAVLDAGTEIARAERGTA